MNYFDIIIIFVIILHNYVNCQQKLLASDGVDGDYFGYSVTTSGEYVIVGAADKDTYRGAAYIYRNTTNEFIEVKTLLASDGTSHDYFGASVSIYGEYVIVGAYGKDSFRGAAYIFMNTSNDWIEVKKIVASDGVEVDTFGISVAIYGEYAIVGAFKEDSHRGAAYIFMKISNDWIEVKKLVASDRAGNDQYGRSVSIFGEYAIVGAPFKNSQRGASYMYRNISNDWIEVKKLVASDGVSSDYFGISVSISNESAIVGASYKDTQRGAAYIFMNTSNDWIEVKKLVTSDPVSGDQFGTSVSISGKYAMVGAFGKDSFRGASYLYTKVSNDWIEIKKLVAWDGVNNDMFGNAVYISDEYAISGTYGANSARGASYMYPKCFAGSIMNGMNCSDCVQGTYSPYGFSMECLSCPAGSYCPDIATATPITCSSGTYSIESNRSTDCPVCPAQSYCPTPITIHDCPAGSYCPQSSTSSITCALHSYCPSNSSSENLCPAGYYCTSPSTIAECPAGQDCEEGTVTPNKLCPAGYYCEYGKPKKACVTNGYYCDQGSSSEKVCSTSCPPDKPYVVSKCTHNSNLQCSKSIVINNNQSFAVPWTLLGVTSGLVVTVLVMSKLLGRQFPQSKSIRLFMFIFAIVDSASDVIFIWHVHPLSHKAFIGSIGVFVLSILAQGGYLSYLVSNWMNDDKFQSFVSERTFWFGLVFVVSCTNIESILFLSSKCFALDMLSAPLNRDDELLVERGGSLSVLFETLPQLVIQLLVALDQKELSGPIGFALLISVIQLCVAISKYVWICVLHRKKKKKKYSLVINDGGDEPVYTELVDKTDDDNNKEVIDKRRRELEDELKRLNASQNVYEIL